MQSVGISRRGSDAEHIIGTPVPCPQDVGVGPEHTESSKTFTQDHKLHPPPPPTGKVSLLHHSQDGEAEEELHPSGRMPYQQFNTTQH